MDTKSREALLRTDLNMCSTVCRRYCGLCFIVASLKWDIPAPFDIFLSMAAQGACESASTIVSSLESLPLYNPAFRLGILGGIVEARNHPILPNTLKANVCQPEVRPALLRSLEQFLCHASTPSITTEAIALLTKLLESTSANGQDKFSEAEAEMLKSSLLCALTHCDDSEQFVINLVSRLFDTIFALVFDNGRVLNTLSHWLLTSVVQEAVLGSPYCLHEAVILTKGALRLLKCLLKYVNLTWLLEKSPHLMTSLILAFAWNYTAAYAGDLVNCILSRCPPFTFVAPLEAFLLHGELDCPLSQQLRHLDETSVDVVTYAEVVLIGLSHSNDLIRAKACAAVCAITSHLPSLHLSCDTPLPLRQLVFTGLVSLLSSPDPTARNTVIHGFVEMSQCVRNRCAALKDHNKGTLHGPAKGFRVAGYPDVQRRFFDLKPVMGIKSPAAVDLCQLEDLDDLLYFASLLWFRCTSDSHTSFIFPGQPPAVDGCVEGDMSTCITELLSTPLFPPGMPYQRQKTLITLLRHMFDLLYFWQPSQQQRPTASAKSIKKVGFEPSTSKNLQERLNQLLSERDFPSPRELSTWLQLIASLPNVNTEVSVSQLCRLLSLLRHMLTRASLSKKCHGCCVLLFTAGEKPRCGTLGPGLSHPSFAAPDRGTSRLDLVLRLAHAVQRGSPPPP
ncbi:unnamed protein product [Schistocephalus solidus]|uniref:DUF2428 domain-containing protein n=1 Tax=Schistocephalus solidus TaxID=70667 RepID=A0A183S9F7_SCHSO|nr:unnamed protein product [Schistocephalus solidus]